MPNLSQHERAVDGKDEWLTDPKIIKALGEFDLDPCAPVNRPWDMAKSHYTIEDDGLSKAWRGRVWLNPPYGNQTTKWIESMSFHKNGIALIYARTETKTFFPYVWERADSVFFFKGRLLFYNVDGTPCVSKKTGKIQYAGGPSMLVAYDKENSIAIQNSGLLGRYVPLKPYQTLSTLSCSTNDNQYN